MSLWLSGAWFKAETHAQPISSLIIFCQRCLPSHRFRQHVLTPVNGQGMAFEERPREGLGASFQGVSKDPCEPIFEHAHATDGALVAILPMSEEIGLFFQWDIADSIALRGNVLSPP